MRVKARKLRDSLHSNLSSGEWRYETFEGRPHLIVPVVLMSEGVHNGSGGPFYYPAEELSNLAEAWNGVPVPVFHPENNGAPCTCNDPRIIERQNIGRMFNVHWEENKLKGEAWIDIAKAEAVYNGLIEMLKDPKVKMEVSTGLLAEHEMTPGVWNGEEYEGIIRNIRPDHLAFLPGSRGACSWEDGCGVRNMDKTTEKYLTNLMGQRETHQKIYQFVDSMDNEMTIHYLEEVYDDYFIYRKETRQVGNQGTMYFKVPYSFKEDGTLNADFDARTQVKKTVAYEAVTNNQDKGDANMATRKDDKDKDVKPTNNECPECKAVVDSLIANEATQWTEEDREFLEEYDLKTLQKMEPVVKEEPKVDANSDDKGTDTGTPDADTQNAEPMTSQKYIDSAPAEIREVLNSAMSTYKNRKKELIKTITANAKNRFTKEALQKKPVDELEMLADLAVDANFEGIEGAHVQNDTNEEEALVLPILNYEKK